MNNVTIDFKGIELEVVGKYYEEEPMVMYYQDGSGHPGFPSQFEVLEIIYLDPDLETYTDVYPIYDSLELIEEISQLALEKYES